MDGNSSQASEPGRSRAAGRDPARSRARAERSRGKAYAPPAFEVICLACEVSAYAPDEDAPLL